MYISFSRNKIAGALAELWVAFACRLYTCNSDSASMSIHVVTLRLKVYFVDNPRNILSIVTG
jgi:hypothetical protein